MTAREFMRFALWARKQPEEGRGIVCSEVMAKFDVCRASAFRLIGYYFDANDWAWPRPLPASPELRLVVRRIKDQARRERYAAFNHPNPQARSA